MTDLLGEVPPEALLEGPPDGDLVLHRTLRQIRAEAAADRRRRLVPRVAAAAAAVAVLAGGGVAVGRVTAPEPVVVAAPAGPAPGAVTLRGDGRARRDDGGRRLPRRRLGARVGERQGHPGAASAAG